MGEVTETFRELRGHSKKALVPFLTAGDPSPSGTLELVEVLVEAGADILELGIPFSDPVADGLSVQSSYQRALRGGITPRAVLGLVRSLKERIDLPVVLMSYLNPVLRFGMNRFLSEAKQCGVDGLIIVDMPVEESAEYLDHARKLSIDTIFLISPTTSDERVSKIIKSSTGFAYLVSLKGVTGARQTVHESAFHLLRRVVPLARNLPVVVGFGVSRAEHVRALISEGADGVVVGSALLDTLARNIGNLDQAKFELKRLTVELCGATKPQ